MRNRQSEIKAKGFAMMPRPAESVSDYSEIDFSKIRVGLQTLDDAILDLGSLKQTNRTWGDKKVILRALSTKDYVSLRAASNYFYEMSGIYERLCKYFAFLYRYDWYVVPYVDDDSVKEDKVLADFSRVLNYLDNSNLKYMFGNIALDVIKNGCYYGYIVDTGAGMTLQQLPIQYCRSRYMVGDVPAVEFNMKFFDDKFPNIEYRMRILKMFPEEFAKGYLLYKKNKLVDTDGTGSAGWYLLDPDCAVKINLHGSDYPILANTMPLILDLDAAQDLDRRKTMQKLLKIIIQKLPLDKNGDLIFDVDEAKDIHNNVVQMLKRAVGVDVMTTFADVEVADLADKNTTTSTDDLAKVERALFNAAGTSQNLFNSEGNIALTNSILNDEASMRNLILQFQTLLNRIISRKFPNKKRYNFRAVILETTIHNYQELAKIYKEQVQLGYSKMLPQIALGHSQSSVIANAHFENNILHLYEIMIPPMMSSTMNPEAILGQNTQGKTQSKQTGSSESTGGRPEKPDNQKSEKTIQNKESAN